MIFLLQYSMMYSVSKLPTTIPEERRESEVEEISGELQLILFKMGTNFVDACRN